MPTHACMYQIYLIALKYQSLLMLNKRRVENYRLLTLPTYRQYQKPYTQVPNPKGWILQENGQTTSINTFTRIDNHPRPIPRNQRHVETSEYTFLA